MIYISVFIAIILIGSLPASLKAMVTWATYPKDIVKAEPIMYLPALWFVLAIVEYFIIYNLQ